MMSRSGSPIERSLVRRMTRSLERRGPDDERFYFDNHLGMGFRRLSIVDIRNGHQPMGLSGTGLHLVCNGEIYNAPALRKALLSRGHVFQTKSDCEVVLHLYREKKERCVDELEGMFAFALWDADGRVLFLARDPLGIKPLYYAETSKHFFFASEPKAILECADIPRTPNLSALESYLQSLAISEPECAFACLHKLPAGTTLKIDGRKKKSRRYWQVEQSVVSWRGSSKTDLSHLLLATLQRSVRISVPSEVECGLLLSGGLDSTALLALATHEGLPLRTYSAGFSEKAFDESEHSARAAKFFGSKHTSIRVTESDATKAFMEIAPHLDEPFADSSLLPTYLVAKAASRDVKVVLSGEGSDEIFGGSAWHGSDWRPHTAPFPPARAIFSAQEASALLREVAGKRVSFSRRPSLPVRDLLQVQLNYDLVSYLPSDLLYKLDRASMWNAVEGRVPFLNQPLLEWVQSLPPSMKAQGAQKKIQLKAALAKIIPSSILKRPKKGFGIPLDYWMWEGKKFRSMVEETLRDRRTKERGMASEPLVDRLFKEHDRLVRPHGYRLWTLFVIETWFRNFIDGKAARTP